jgi:ferric-dicitrate binding protein FerR (iron transport regulator)
MDKPYFIGLLHKYLHGTSTKEEEQFIISYYDLFRDEPEVMELLSPEKKEALKKDMQSAIWDTIAQDERQDKKVRSITRRRVMVAAAAILLIVLTGGLFFKSATPAAKKAEPVISTAVVELKENHLVALPDGSTVVLSYGSKLDYPSSFEGLPRREVYLTGQAFFDIRKNAARSFIVHTGKLTTTVLGTSFNIKAYPGDMDITVTVKKGAVRVSDQHKTLGIIRPDQQIIYNKQKANSIQKEVADDNYLDWKQRDLLFDNLTVEEAARLLEERFNVKISISSPSIRTRRFTTTFPRNETLEEALKSICEFNEAVFSYDKEKAAVMISDSDK